MKAKKLTKETINQLGIYDRKFPKFEPGDTISVSQRIKEGDKERIQVFQGDVLQIRKNGASTTFTVRKMSANGIAVERIFPYYSAIIDSIEFIKKGKVRRAKLYYVRDRVGKSARLKEQITKRKEEIVEEESPVTTQEPEVKS
jgi:large subunit ribosomal protein L19